MCEIYDDVPCGSKLIYDAEQRIQKKLLLERLKLPTPEDARQMVRERNEAVDNQQLIRIIEDIKYADENYIIFRGALRENVEAALRKAGYVVSDNEDVYGNSLSGYKISWDA
jgi:hypothetical protein